jgi:hypothetical protein
LEKLHSSYAVYGEIMGPGIRRNLLDLKNYEYFVYSIWDIANQNPLGLEQIETTCKLMGLPTVPIAERDWVLGSQTVEDVLSLADGKYASGRVREGLVVRPMKPFISKVTGDFFSFKAISNQYLGGGGN